MPLDMDVMIEAAGWSKSEKWRAIFTPVVAVTEATITELANKNYEIAVLLCDDAIISAHNRKWRGQDRATNVLSFPAPELAKSQGHLGDILLSLDTILREASEQGKSIEQHARHLFLHGLLHLLGQDHRGEHEAADMEALETKILLELGDPDPYEENDSTEIFAHP